MPRKKYSINWENDEPVSFEVDGVVYDSIEEIAEEADREKLTAMMDNSWDHEFEKQVRDFDREFQKGWEQHKQTSVKVEKLILGVFTGVAVLMLLIAAVSSYSAVSKMSREESAPGRIVDIVVQREYINQQDRIIRDYYYPVVDFTSSDGRHHSTRLTEGSQSQFYEIGNEVTVRYDPEHPLDARIKSFGSDALMWVLPGITGILGLGFLGAVIAVRKFMPSTETNELA
jgi:hypothetical protein